MGRKRHTAEQIISKLRIAEVETAKGQSIGQVCRKLEIWEQTYYKWRREYGGMRTDQAKRLKDLERENAQLKKLVADQALDNSILKEAISANDTKATNILATTHLLHPGDRSLFSQASLLFPANPPK